tara:strand:- start:1514 stop:2434 length:921 start_codon:yes stop_codon:yes gene_type:complete
MKIGLIGNGNQTKRIKFLLQEKKLPFFIYKPNKPNYFDANLFSKLKKSKVIFILSPNNTHFKYIKDLFQGRYIFCEKPPVNKLEDLLNLKKMKKGKIYFNYNFRFSKLSLLIEKYKNKFGKLLYSNIINGHGLAKKKDYSKSWRSKKTKCPKGVFEIVSIHWIDLINFHFGIKKINRPKLLNSSKVGSSFDTSVVELETKNQANVNIFSTYNSPFSKRAVLIFENGIIEQIDEKISIRGPAKNFDKNGLFKTPKLIFNISIKDTVDYKNSLKSSLNYFLDTVKKNKQFKKNLFNCSIQSNQLILKK